MSTAYTAPFFQQQYLGSDGLPIAGGHINFYAAGSTVRKAIWLDRTHQNEAPNPLPLDSAGVPTKQYFLDDGLYDIAIYSAAGVLVHTLYNIETSGGGSGTATDAGMKRYYTWFVMDSTYPLPTADNLTKISALDIETMLEFGYGCTGNTQTTSTTSTSIWYVEAWDGTTAKWSETIVDTHSEIINLDRGNCNTLDPHPNRSISDQQVFTTYPAGLYNLVPIGDGFYWKPLVVKEIPDPTYTATGALVYDATTHVYRWAPFDELGGKVKVDTTDSTAGFLSDKLIADNDAAGKQNIILTNIGADGTNKQYGAHVDVDTVYDEILTKMNPPSYDLFGAYPDKVGVCQLTGIGAALKAKTLEDANGNPIAWQTGTGQNGANYGRSCIPGYAYVKNATGAMVKKRIWCAFGSTGEIYNSFDRYQSTTRDTSLIDADYGYSRIPQGAASCAAYILDNGNYYWMYGGFVDNYVYLLEDIPANYNDDGSFKSTGWVWTACPGLAQNVSHVCSVKTGGFLYTGYHLGGINYKPSVAATAVQAIANPPRTNENIVFTATGDGFNREFEVAGKINQSYNSYGAVAKDSNGNTLPVSQVIYVSTTNTFAVYLKSAPASGLSVTITVSSYQYNAGYTGAGLSGLGSDHYGTYNVIDRDTGRIYSNTTEALTGTFTNSHVENGTTISDWKLLSLYVRESDSDNYPATTTDRLGTCYGNITGDPYTWWAGLQSAYGLWVATIALKQYADDPIYAYSDDGIHWTKYTDGVGTGTGSTLAIWDSQSDGMNWFVTNMYASSPLIFELLVNSIPSHKRFVAEKGMGVSGDAFLVDLPNAGILSTDENGKLVASSGPNPSGGAYVPSMDPASATQVLMPSIVGTAIEVLTLVSPRTDVTITTATTLNISTIKGGTGSLYLTIRDSNYNLIAVTAAVTNPTANDKLTLPLASIYKPLTQEAVAAYTLTSGTQYYIGLWTSVSGATYLGSTCSVLTAAIPHPGHIFTGLSAVTPTLSGGSESQMRIYCAIEQD